MESWFITPFLGIDRYETSSYENSAGTRSCFWVVYRALSSLYQDQYLQNIISTDKDVEGLCHKFVYNMYHNIRYLDKEEKKKCIIPCTPLAVVKVCIQSFASHLNHLHEE